MQFDSKQDRREYVLRRSREGATLAQIGRELGVTGGRAQQIASQAKRHQNYIQQAKQSDDKLWLAELNGEVSAWVRNQLCSIGIWSKPDLVDAIDSERLRLDPKRRVVLLDGGRTSLGESALKELFNWLGKEWQYPNKKPSDEAIKGAITTLQRAGYKVSPPE